MHYFIDHSKIASESKAYGPVTADPTKKYNVTTQFQLTDPAKAFACQDSLLLLVQSAADSALVNVILKPVAGLDIPFGKIKYYVYRGMQKSSFIVGDDIAPKEATSSDFLKDLWTDYDLAQLLGLPDVPEPTPESLGYMPLPDGLNVEILFSTLDEIAVGKNKVFEGTWIGNFSTACGFEIITENDNYKIDLGYLKKSEHIFDITGLASGTDEQKFILKCEKDKILNYIDPAAFWGMHYEKGVTVDDPAELAGQRKVVKEKIYTELLNKYSTKNRVYLDIRSEYGYSYNFYENYSDGTAAKNNLKFKVQKADPYQDNKYGKNDWPIFFNDTGTAEALPQSSFFVQLRVDDNLKPLLFFENEKQIPYTNRKCFLDETLLRNGTSTDWTKEIQFKFPNVTEGANVVYVSNYLKAQYFRQDENPGSPDTVIRVDNKTSKGIRLVTNPWFNEIAYHHIDKKAFVTGNNFAFVSEGELFYDATNAVLSVKNSFPYLNSKNKYAKLDLSNEPLKSISTSPVFPKEMVVNRWQVAETSAINTDILEISGFSKNFTIPFKEDIFLLGLTTAEYDALNSNTDISNLHSRMVVLEEIPNQADFNLGIPYRKYIVKLLGLNSLGKTAVTTPSPALHVYGSGTSILASRAFASAANLTNLLPDPATMEEYEFVGSFSYDPNDPIVTPLFSTGTITVEDFDAPVKPSETISLIGEVHFPVDVKGSSTISSKKANYPLIAILHGNGQRYSNYRQLCEHLAHNGFIAVSVSCLKNNGTTTFPLTQLSAATPDRYFFKGDTVYIYNNESGPSADPDYEFEKVTALQFRDVDTTTNPPTFLDPTITLLPWEKGKDFTIKTDGAGKPVEIKLLFTIGGHHLNPVGRSRILYPHLKVLNAKFGNKIQDNIGIMGHSRGGQAVVRVPEEIGKPGFTVPPTLKTIKAVASLAPTDIDSWGKENLDENIPYFVLYGSRDGDVSGVKDTGFSLWDRAKNNKSMAFVYQATHNGFITNDHDWTDDGNDISDVIPRTSQQTMAKSYFNAFFRMTLRNETLWKPLFTGEAQTKSISSSDHKEVLFQYQDKAPVKLIDDFQDATQDWTVVNGVGDDKLDLLTVASSPHETISLSLDWTAYCKLTYQFLAAKNVNSLGYFSFRITRVVGKTGDVGDLQVEIRSGASTYSVLVREYFKIPEPDLRPDDPGLRKSALMTIRIPLSRYRDNGVDLTNVTELNFIFPGIGSGTVEMDNIEFTD